LSTNTANNKEIRDCLSKINIEYCDWSDLTTPERRLFVATLYTIYMMHAINKKNIGSEQANQITSESLLPNMCEIESRTPQQNWNPQIQATPQPQEIACKISHVEQNVVHLDQEFSDL